MNKIILMIANQINEYTFYDISCIHLASIN